MMQLMEVLRPGNLPINLRSALTVTLVPASVETEVLPPTGNQGLVLICMEHLGTKVTRS